MNCDRLTDPGYFTRRILVLTSDRSVNRDQDILHAENWELTSDRVTGTWISYPQVEYRKACIVQGHIWTWSFWSVFEEYPLDSTRSDSTMTLSIMNSAIISVVVESSRCSSKTLQKGSCPYAPLNEVLQYCELTFEDLDLLMDQDLVNLSQVLESWRASRRLHLRHWHPFSSHRYTWLTGHWGSLALWQSRKNFNRYHVYMHAFASILQPSLHLADWLMGAPCSVKKEIQSLSSTI